MKQVFLLILFMAALSIPVHAAPDEGVNDEVLATDVSSPVVREELVESTPISETMEEGVALYAGSDSLAGGYYFVCDCTLGSKVKTS